MVKIDSKNDLCYLHKLQDKITYDTYIKNLHNNITVWIIKPVGGVRAVS